MKESLLLKDVVLLGRTLDEYEKYFSLEELDLKDEKILDMGSGVSSFCCEASQKGLDVTAADPIYAYSSQSILDKCKEDLDEVVRQLPEVQHKYLWNFYENIDALRRYREKAYRLFIPHYQENPGKYIAASLPTTKFEENQFTFTLVSHLLFLYEEMLDYEFHKRSMLELARITSKEVRIYPLCNLKAERSSYVDRIMADKDCKELEFKIRPVPFEFFRGSTEMLLLRKGK
jgi:hypothetical protein